MKIGPNIKTDNLVFGMDTGYSVLHTNEKVYKYNKGEPTENLVPTLTLVVGRWGDLVVTVDPYTNDNGREGINVVILSGTSGGINYYNVSTVNAVGDTTYVVSANVKYDEGNGVPHGNLFYVREYQDGAQLKETGGFNANNTIDLGNGWKRAYRTFTTLPNTNILYLQGYEYSTGRNIRIDDIQLEIKPNLSPFTNYSTIRNPTESLIDFSRNSTIDVSNASFNSESILIFDSTNLDFIDTYWGKDHNPYLNPITISCWVKLTTGIGDRMILSTGQSRGNADVNQRLYVGYKSGSWEMGIRNTPWGTSSTTVDTDYHNIVLVIDSTSARLHIDSKLIITKTVDSAYVLNDFLKLGAHDDNYYADCNIPVLKVYETAFDQQDIDNDYNSMKSRFNI